jgi:hypothetical protein
MVSKRYPLPKRFQTALSEKAYARLRKLNEKYQFGNNYILTILLENLDEIADHGSLDHAIRTFEKEYGAPMENNSKFKD